MYKCLECNILFKDPKVFMETHGLESPPYEKWHGCPKCSGNFTECLDEEMIEGKYDKCVRITSLESFENID